MAEPRRGSGSGFKFFLLVVYVAAYAFLRYQGEIAMQQIALPAPNGGVEIFRMVGAQPDLPHWRQQTWRAVFSFAMVIEEEGRKFLNQGMDSYRGARGGYPDGQGNYPGGQNAYQQNFQGTAYQGGQNSLQGAQGVQSGMQGQYQGRYQATPQNGYPGRQTTGGGMQPGVVYQSGPSGIAPASGERVVWDGRTQPMSELPNAVRR